MPVIGGQPLTSGTGSGVDAVAFSPDGHTLASGNNDGITWLWDLDVRYAIKRICATAGGLTPQQWHTYISQSRYQTPCAQGSALLRLSGGVYAADAHRSQGIAYFMRHHCI